MDLAGKLLEDRAFVIQFLQKSQGHLLRSRLLAEDLLTRAGINYHQKGCVSSDPYRSASQVINL